MKQENNAKKTFSELASKVGFGKNSASQQPEESAPAAPTPAPAESFFKPLHTTEEAAPAAPVAPIAPAAPVAPVVEEAVAAPVAPPKSKSIIASDVSVNGSIVAKSDLDILGTHTGTIESEGCVTITGSVTGDVSAESLMLQGCVVVADQLTVAKEVRIDAGSTITANIVCESIIVTANLTGNIRATKSCRINASAVVNGDIAAGAISIGEGASISSKIQILAN